MLTLPSSQVEETVRRALSEVMPELSAAGDADDLFDLGLDSLRVVEYLLKIESELQIEFDLDDVSFASFGTVAAAVKLVSEKLEGKSHE